VSLTGSRKCGQFRICFAGWKESKAFRVWNWEAMMRLIVLERCRLDLAVELAIQRRMAKYRTIMCRPKRMLLSKQVAEQFIMGCKWGWGIMKLGDPMDPKNRCRPMLVRKARTNNSMISTEDHRSRGNSHSRWRRPDRKGAFFNPKTILGLV